MSYGYIQYVEDDLGRRQKNEGRQTLCSEDLHFI